MTGEPRAGGTPLGVLAAHAAHALAAHRQWLARNGYDEPPELRAVLTVLKSLMAPHGPADEPHAPTGLHDAAMPEPQLYTIGQAARELRLSRASVERLIASGALASIKIGAARRIRRSDLDAFVDRLGAGAEPGFRARMQSKGSPSGLSSAAPAVHERGLRGPAGDAP